MIAHAIYLLIVAFILACLTLFGVVLFTGKKAITDHLLRYSGSYLMGSLFFVSAFITAFTGEFHHVTPEQFAAMTDFDWFMKILTAFGASLVAIIAFCNKTNARDQEKPFPNSNPIVK